MRTLLYIVLALVVSGCAASSSSHVKRLDEAQRLMAGNPREAFERLNAIDVSEFDDSATMARWALLYSEAMVANNLTAPSDSIVNIAVDYYGHRNLTDELNKARRLKELILGETDNALVTALYLQKEKEFMLFKERIKRERYMLFGLIILTMSAGVILWQRQRMKIQSIKNDALMSEASALRYHIDAATDDMGRLQSTLSHVLEKRFTLIDSLCQTYYESQGTKSERKAIIENVKGQIESLKTDESAFAEMERTVNECRGNILHRIKADYPDIKNDDYRLATYLACGLSNRTISLLLGETVEVIYKRKSRLKIRLKEKCTDGNADIMSIF